MAVVERWSTIKKIQLKTKSQVVITLFLLFILVGISVESLTRTITDTSDNIETFIKNSNGNYWDVNSANIQTAIDDINIAVPYESWGAPHGTVWLPGNTTIITTSTIYVKPHVTLDLGGCVLKPNGNFEVINLTTGSIVQNGCINVSGVSNYNKDCIGINSHDMINARSHPLKILDMELISASQRGIGIYLHTWGTEYNQYIVWLDVHNIKLRSLKYGIFLDHTVANSDGAYINGNTFTDIIGYDCKYFIYVYEIDPEASGNYFSNVQCYCTSNTESIIWNNGQGNVYDTIIAYNWDNASGTKTSYNFSVRGPGSTHYAAHQCFLSFIGGGDDIAIGAWKAYTPANRYTILNLEDSSLIIGYVYEQG